MNPEVIKAAEAEKGEFLKFLSHARDKFCIEIMQEPWNTRLRTQAEDFLIAFDQVRERYAGYNQSRLDGSPKWVKASERLPEQSGRIVWRWLDKLDSYCGYIEGKGFLYGRGGASVHPMYYAEIEWLDETADESDLTSSGLRNLATYFKNHGQAKGEDQTLEDTIAWIRRIAEGEGGE